MGRAVMLPLRKAWKQADVVYVWFVDYISSAYLNHVRQTSAISDERYSARTL